VNKTDREKERIHMQTDAHKHNKQNNNKSHTNENKPIKRNRFLSSFIEIYLV